MHIETAHRPWPVPNRPWAMFMRWYELMFMHWPVPAAALRPLVPAALELDTYDGQAWLGIVPFRMCGIRGRCLPPFPGLSAFPELNVRTYVTAEGKPGVWFFSLDATSRIAVRVARKTFHLNYYDAQISAARKDASPLAPSPGTPGEGRGEGRPAPPGMTNDGMTNDERRPNDEARMTKEVPPELLSSFVIENSSLIRHSGIRHSSFPERRLPRTCYSSRRVHRDAPPAEFAARYGPVGDVFHAKPGTLEYFLTERYCLYTADARGNCFRGDIAHAPWPLQVAESETQTLAMTEQLGLKLPDVPPLLHYAGTLDVIAWIIERAAR